MFDPVSRAQVPIITSVFLYTGVIVFFLLDGHHAVLRGLAYTLTVVPVGGFSPPDVNVRVLIAAWGNVYGLGFMLIAPSRPCCYWLSWGWAFWRAACRR